MSVVGILMRSTHNRGDPEEILDGGRAMRDRWDEDADLSPEARPWRRHRQRRSQRLTPRERAYLEARRTAEAKISLYREAVKLGIPVLLLLVFIPWVGVILVAVGAVRVGRRYYRISVEPQMRERFVE